MYQQQLNGQDENIFHLPDQFILLKWKEQAKPWKNINKKFKIGADDKIYIATY